MKHTPSGQWIIRRDTRYDNAYSIEKNENGRRSIIALMNDTWICEEHGTLDANARLIAAAPDMLDMLKTIDLRLDIEKNEGKINYILSATHNDIKELIKKAEVSE